jgi:prepilin-type N-terminal cleavage/methylation domain-containing protein
LNKIDKINWDSGFTLIEMLVYVAIFSIIVGALVSFMLLMSQSRINNQIVLEVNGQGTEVVRVITQALRNAVNINTPATSTSASLLSINTTLASTTPTTFTITSGVLYKTEGINPSVALTNSKVIVSNLNFSNLSKTATFGTVRVSFTISDNSASAQAQYNYSANFYASASLR